MHTGKRYTPFEFAKWTKRDTLLMLLIATVPTILYVIGWKFIGLPWQPVAILGTAVAFIVGFKNNASYNRIWEARQIYGAIINDSRSFAYSVRDTLGGKESSVVKRIFYRHFAWLTALRFQLREPRSWENMNQRSNSAYRKSRYEIPELNSTLEEELKQYLSGEDLEYILSKKIKRHSLQHYNLKSLES